MASAATAAGTWSRTGDLWRLSVGGKRRLTVFYDRYDRPVPRYHVGSFGGSEISDKCYTGPELNAHLSRLGIPPLPEEQ